MERPTRRPLCDVLSEFPGCYVAVSWQTNEPVAVARDPLELAAEVRRRDLHGVAVVYARYPDELELVGPG